MDEEKKYVFKDEFLDSLPTEEEMRQGNAQNEQKTNARAEGCLRLVFIQTVAFVMIVLSALVMKSVAPKAYAHIKSSYTAATTQQDVNFTDIKSFFEKIGDFIFSPPKKEKAQTSSAMAHSESSSVAESETQTDSSSIAEPESGAAGGSDEGSRQLPQSVSTNTYVLTTSISAPTKGTVTSPFGWRVHPITGNLGFHTGIDIANIKGTPITAAFSGTIYECGKNEAYGNYIIMRHSDGLYTFYGHCESLKATEGMNIRSGEIIAYMGSTGYSTGPHLHFEIRIDGKRVDPAYVLKGIEDIEF